MFSDLVTDMVFDVSYLGSGFPSIWATIMCPHQSWIYSICHHFIESIRVLISGMWQFLVKTILHAVFSFDPIFFAVLDNFSYSFAVFNKHRVHQFWDFAVLMFYEIKLSFFLVTIFYNHFDLWCVKKYIYIYIYSDPSSSMKQRHENSQ